MITRQTAAVTKTDDGRNHTTRFSYTNLFAQALRGIVQNSKQGVTGDQIKSLIGKW